MQQLRILSRTILKSTGYKKYPYKEQKEAIIYYGDSKYSNCSTDENNPKLRIKFTEELNTSDTEEVKNYMNNLRKTESDKWIKEIIEYDILKTKKRFKDRAYKNEEILSKDFKNKNFKKCIETLLNKNYKVYDIREHNDCFKFTVNHQRYIYFKDTKRKDIDAYIENLISAIEIRKNK